jgi:predicted glycoside hydrolase/deacetylase ChbG (UPF0249 family)
MVGGASAATAATEATSLGLSVGLHINLTEGLPLCSAEDVPTLLNQHGEMLGKFGFRQALAAGRVDLAQVRAEVQAQLSRFMELTAGRSPSHCDGHQAWHVVVFYCMRGPLIVCLLQHVHVLSDVATIIAEVRMSSIPC